MGAAASLVTRVEPITPPPSQRKKRRGHGLSVRVDTDAMSPVGRATHIHVAPAATSGPRPKPTPPSSPLPASPLPLSSQVGSSPQPRHRGSARSSQPAGQRDNLSPYRRWQDTASGGGVGSPGRSPALSLPSPSSLPRSPSTRSPQSDRPKRRMLRSLATAVRGVIALRRGTGSPHTDAVSDGGTFVFTDSPHSGGQCAVRTLRNTSASLQSPKRREVGFFADHDAAGGVKATSTRAPSPHVHSHSQAPAARGTQPPRSPLAGPQPQGARSPAVADREARRQQLDDVSAWMRSDVLGVGALGRVFLALNQRTGGIMVAKETSVGRHAKRLWRRVARLRCVVAVCCCCCCCLRVRRVADTCGARFALHSRLRHPNLVSYLGSDARGRHGYVFIQWMAGGSLNDLLQPPTPTTPPARSAVSPRSTPRGSPSPLPVPMPEATACKYVKPVLQGLAFLHSMGESHGSLKPSNVWSDEAGNVLLGDFGVRDLVSFMVRHAFIYRRACAPVLRSRAWCGSADASHRPVPTAPR